MHFCGTLRNRDVAREATWTYLRRSRKSAPMAAPSKGAKNLGQFREETDFAGSGADYHGETIGFLVWAVDDDNAADGFDQNRLVMVADQVCEFSLAGLVERRNAQFEQFVMVERRVDFPVQVFGQSFLAYDDHRL